MLPGNFRSVGSMLGGGSIIKYVESNNLFIIKRDVVFCSDNFLNRKLSKIVDVSSDSDANAEWNLKKKIGNKNGEKNELYNFYVVFVLFFAVSFFISFLISCVGSCKMATRKIVANRK